MAFVVDPRPGLLEEHLQGRAKMVRPAECVEQPAEPTVFWATDSSHMGIAMGVSIAGLLP